MPARKSVAAVAGERAWFHIVLTTYGSWLYGDERGFRTRGHREHVEGDYKRPPTAGLYRHKAQRSRPRSHNRRSSCRPIGGPSSVPRW